MSASSEPDACSCCGGTISWDGDCGDCGCPPEVPGQRVGDETVVGVVQGEDVPAGAESAGFIPEQRESFVLHTLPASWFRWSPTGTPPAGTPIKVTGGVGRLIEAVVVGSDVLCRIAVPAPGETAEPINGATA